MNAIKPEPNPGNVLLICPQFSYSFWSFRETLQIQGIKAAGSPLGLL